MYLFYICPFLLLFWGAGFVFEFTGLRRYSNTCLSVLLLMFHLMFEYICFMLFTSVHFFRSVHMSGCLCLGVFK